MEHASFYRFDGTESAHGEGVVVCDKKYAEMVDIEIFRHLKQENMVLKKALELIIEDTDCTDMEYCPYNLNNKMSCQDCNNEKIKDHYINQARETLKGESKWNI